MPATLPHLRPLGPWLAELNTTLLSSAICGNTTEFLNTTTAPHSPAPRVPWLVKSPVQSDTGAQQLVSLQPERAELGRGLGYGEIGAISS